MYTSLRYHLIRRLSPRVDGNRNIVLDTALRATMTKTEIETKKEPEIVIPYTLTDNYVELDESLPTV